ncbi:hypothetical protein SAMN05216525_16110 [Bradyrhizobium sp. Gha]|nr:hypothetical protein SAMN05216525_16110 [Bradyrhizobium sp. Gha]
MYFGRVTNTRHLAGITSRRLLTSSPAATGARSSNGWRDVDRHRHYHLPKIASAALAAATIGA